VIGWVAVDTYSKACFNCQVGKPDELARIPYHFIEDGLTHAPYPHYQCPTLIIHGLKDEVVPVGTTLKAIEDPSRGNMTTTVLVDDDHALTKEKTLKLACNYILELLGVGSGKGKLCGSISL